VWIGRAVCSRSRPIPAEAIGSGRCNRSQHRRAFRRHVKWRIGIEGRISTLKRGYGWDRARIDTTEGAKIWTGHGVLAHNLVKISALAD
jgi:transposase, IS5 family